jgi:hypothetical protein
MTFTFVSVPSTDSLASTEDRGGLFEPKSSSVSLVSLKSSIVDSATSVTSVSTPK